jgi:hypothetical protein
MIVGAKWAVFMMTNCLRSSFFIASDSHGIPRLLFLFAQKRNLYYSSSVFLEA